jgi:hypothetical protein
MGVCISKKNRVDDLEVLCQWYIEDIIYVECHCYCQVTTSNKKR